MADLFEKRLADSHASFRASIPARSTCPPERRFIGFDAYRKAIDCLRPGDVAMLTGYSGFRPAQLEYAVEKGINVFMEKSFATDPPGVRRVIKAGEAARRRTSRSPPGCNAAIAQPPGTHPAYPRRRTGKHPLIRAYRMQACGAWAEAARGKGTELAYPQFHQFPLGLGRAVRGNEYPPDRRALLAQGRLPVSRTASAGAPRTKMPSTMMLPAMEPKRPRTAMVMIAGIELRRVWPKRTRRSEMPRARAAMT